MTLEFLLLKRLVFSYGRTNTFFLFLIDLISLLGVYAKAYQSLVRKELDSFKTVYLNVLISCFGFNGPLRP